MEGVKFQHYRSAKTSMRLISSKGTKITFVRHEFVTCDNDAIEYLNTEIDNGTIPGITKGELLSREEADPMAMLRKQMKAEAKAEMEAEAVARAKGVEKYMGETDNKPAIKPVSTKGTGGNAAGSSS
jgi:hypothetical protein